jgi:hypothetical protein
LYVKPIKKPLIIKSLEAILRRIPHDHESREKVSKKLGNYLSGYYGEQSLAYYLDQLPQKEFNIFHNIRIKTPNITFQIDFLLMTMKFILILEVKNLTGQLNFDGDLAQLIQTKPNEENKVYNDPVVQASDHKRHLALFLSKNNLHNIPISYLVVVTNPNAHITITSTDKNYRDKIIRSNILIKKISKLCEYYQKEMYSQAEMKRVSKLILKSCDETNQDILKRFGIEKSEIIKGVICDKCGYYPMQRIYGSWTCDRCKNTENEVHIQALNDYIYLLDNKITNCEFRSLLNIQSSKVANTLLNKLNLKHTGNNKSRTYHLPQNGFDSEF